MPSESPVNDPATPDAKQSPQDPPKPSTSQPASEPPSGDEAAKTQPAEAPQEQQNGEPPQDGTAAEPGGPVPVPFPGMPIFPYAGPMTRPKRTQCKNACTNCQKACKKCDDGRPCNRCIRYGTTDTCEDSKRKERKKGVKRGPYKKRDSKSSNADAENEEGGGPSSASAARRPRHPPTMPYVGPVGYPPGIWSTYTPGPGAKVEGGGYYQPVFALTPVGGPGPHGGGGENSGGASEGVPHFPVGFYPATFISYPGPYPYPMPAPGQAGGFHYTYPPPPGIYQPRPHNVVASNANSEATAGASGSSDTRKDTPNAGATTNADNREPKDNDTVVEPQVNGKLAETVNDAVVKDTE